jgi:hypothetical protein
MAQRIGRETRLREAVGIFNSPQDVEHVVRDLMTVGFDRADISILATEETVRDKLGRYYQDTHAAADDPRAPRQSWAEPESRAVGQTALTGVLGYIGAVTAGGVAFATGGAAALVIAAGVIGGGVSGGIGFGLGRLIDDEVADSLETQLEHGGIVVWVKVEDEDEASTAGAVLTRHAAQDVHVHDIHLPT